MVMDGSEKIRISSQACHSNLTLQIPDIPDIILIFCTKYSWYFHCWLEWKKTNFRKNKTNTNPNIYFQNAEGEHK